MSKLMEAMPMSTAEDEPRFHEALQQMVSTGQLPEYRAFKSSTSLAKKKVRALPELDPPRPFCSLPLSVPVHLMKQLPPFLHAS